MFGKNKEKESQNSITLGNQESIEEPTEIVEENSEKIEEPIRKDFILVIEGMLLPNGNYQYVIQTDKKLKLGLMEED